MKARGFSIWWLLAILGVTAVAGLILFPVFALRQQRHERDERGQRICVSNLRQIALAFTQYAQDYDDRMPLIKVHTLSEATASSDNPYGWRDAIFPYIRSKMIFHCPLNRSQIRQDDDKRNHTDYYYNSNLDGIETKSIRWPTSTLLAGDGNDGTGKNDARYALNAIPNNWLEDDKSPARRHKGGAHYAFIDGHVKWCKPEQVKSIRVSKDDYSFALR